MRHVHMQPPSSQLRCSTSLFHSCDTAGRDSSDCGWHTTAITYKYKAREEKPKRCNCIMLQTASARQERKGPSQHDLQSPCLTGLLPRLTAGGVHHAFACSSHLYPGLIAKSATECAKCKAESEAYRTRLLCKSAHARKHRSQPQTLRLHCCLSGSLLLWWCLSVRVSSMHHMTSRYTAGHEASESSVKFAVGLSTRRDITDKLSAKANVATLS